MDLNFPAVVEEGKLEGEENMESVTKELEDGREEEQDEEKEVKEVGKIVGREEMEVEGVSMDSGGKRRGRKRKEEGKANGFNDMNENVVKDCVSSKRESSRKCSQLAKEKIEKSIYEDMYDWEFEERPMRGRKRKVKGVRNEGNGDEIVIQQEKPRRGRPAKNKGVKIKENHIENVAHVNADMQGSSHPPKIEENGFEDVTQLVNEETPGSDHLSKKEGAKNEQNDNETVAQKGIVEKRRRGRPAKRKGVENQANDGETAAEENNTNLIQGKGEGGGEKRAKKVRPDNESVKGGKKLPEDVNRFVVPC